MRLSPQMRASARRVENIQSALAPLFVLLTAGYVILKFL